MQPVQRFRDCPSLGRQRQWSHLWLFSNGKSAVAKAVTATILLPADIRLFAIALLRAIGSVARSTLSKGGTFSMTVRVKLVCRSTQGLYTNK